MLWFCLICLWFWALCFCFVKLLCFYWAFYWCFSLGKGVFLSLFVGVFSLCVTRVTGSMGLCLLRLSYCERFVVRFLKLDERIFKIEWNVMFCILLLFCLCCWILWHKVSCFVKSLSPVLWCFPFFADVLSLSWLRDVTAFLSRKRLLCMKFLCCYARSKSLFCLNID